MATKRTFPDYSEKYKKAELAKIHIAKQQLGFDDDSYRAMLQTLCGVNSSKDLTAQGRAQLLDYFKKQGFEFKKPKVNKHLGRPNNIDIQPLLKKIEALLTVGHLPWDYALGMAKHMYKKDKLEFCHSTELMGIVAALSKHQKKQEAANGKAS